MTDAITVFAYNVRFGDAILVEVPDGGQRRFILIDLGNVLAGTGGENQPLLDALDDIIARTGGKVDLYVMTHEHLDHVQGLLYGAANGRRLQADEVWMTASTEPTYYDRFPGARRKRLELMEAAQRFAETLGSHQLPAGLTAILEMNNARKTADYVNHIRSQLAATDRVHYLFRGRALDRLHAFTETKLRILAPEEDTSAYYGPRRVSLDAAPPGFVSGSGRQVPPSGVDAGAFYQLIDSMNSGLSDSLLAIDRAANDTSLVLEVTWRGRRLIFPGDAEQRSWQFMAANGDLRPVDLLKVGHHGSHNATPASPILDLILPMARREDAVAVLSTCADVYPSVPDSPTLALIAERTRAIYRTTDVDPGQPIVVALDQKS